MSRHRSPAWAALLAILLPSGCAEQDGRAAPNFEVVDSGSIQIAINSAPAVEQASRISLREDLRLGAVDGAEAEEFVGIRDVSVDDHGRIFVLDNVARTIRVFDAEGQSLGTFGRPGEGPGEFPNELLRMAVGADTVLVLDRFSLHLFTTEQEPVHTTRQEIAGNEIVPVLDRGGSEWFVGRSVFTRPTSIANRLTRDTFRIWPIDPLEGVPRAPVVEVPGLPRWYLEDLGRSTSKYLGPEPGGAVRPNGEIFVTDGFSYDIAVYSSTGELRRRFRAAISPPSLAPGELESAIDRMTSYYDSVGLTAFGEAFVEASRAGGSPEARPIPGQLLVAGNGSVLMERRDLDPDPFPLARSDSTTWDLIGSDGQIEGRLVLAPGTQAEEFTGEFLYVIERDDLGVQYVVRYALSYAGR